jgi:cytochrome c5
MARVPFEAAPRVHAKRFARWVDRNGGPIMRSAHVPWLLAAIALGGIAVAAASADEKASPSAAKVEQTAPMSQAEMEKLSGKDLYKASCKRCHGKDSKSGEYTPMSLIQEQWERFFDEKYLDTHKAVADSTHDAKPVTEWITPKMLEKIRKFAIDGAADSEHPMTCG